MTKKKVFRPTLFAMSSCLIFAPEAELRAAEMEETERRQGWAAAASSAPPSSGTGRDDDVAVTLPTIDVEATIPTEIEYTPGAASELTEKEIETWRPYTLHDASDFVPGVRTIDDDVLGRRSGIGIRGAPPRRSRKTLLLEDGTPINSSTYLDPSAHYTPPLERLESIDVLKGAGHILHGPLNNHGIINFRNKRPTATPETTIDLGGGNLDTFKRHLMHRRTIGPVGLVLSYTGVNADGSFDVEDFQYDDFYGSLDWRINPKQDLGLSFTYFRERSHYDESNLTPQEYAIAPRTKRGRFGQEFNTFALNYLKGDIVHNYQITDKWSMSTKLFITDVDRPRFTTDPGEVFVDPLPEIEFVDPSAEFIPNEQGVMVSRDRYYRTYGAENRMELKNIDALGLKHTFQWGLRFERHLLNDMRSEGVAGEILDEDNRGPKTRDVAFQASAFSGFFQDALQFNNWTVTPGVRVEYYTQKRVRRSIPNDPGPHDPKETDYNTLVLPSISFFYDGFDQTQLFANVARGYTPAFARTAEEFPLDPETGINSQIGVRSTAIKGVSMEAAAFYNIITDTVVQLPFTVEGVNVVLNAEDSESYGVDLGLRIDSSPFTHSPYNFFGQVDYNYTRAEFTDGIVDGNRVPEIPSHAGSLTLGLEHTSGWHVSATLSHFGSFFTDPLNTKELTLADEDRAPVEPGDEIEIREPAVLGEVPSHTLLSARASYKIPNMPLTLWIQGRNLTDKLYIVDLENGIRPGAERTVIGGVQLRF